MYKLDGYTQKILVLVLKILEILKAKGGVAGVKIQSRLSALIQVCSK